MGLVYEQAADDGSVKETIVLHERPVTNVLTYDFRLDGLTPELQADGSLALLDHTRRTVFTIPAPTFNDATGRAGAASYRLAPGQLDIVLDQMLVSTGVLPFEVDPTLVFAVTPGLRAYMGAPWQRQAIGARDGTQALFYHDPTSNSVKIASSKDNFVSLLQDAALFSGGGLGISVDIDPQTDTAYIVCILEDAAHTNYLRLHELPYNASGGRGP